MPSAPLTPLLKLGATLETNQGDEAAYAARREAETLLRAMLDAEYTIGAASTLSQILHWLARVCGERDGPAAAIPLQEEAIKHAEDVFEANSSALNKQNLGHALGALAKYVEDAHGPSEALDPCIKEEAVNRQLAAAYEEPWVQRDWAISLSRLSRLNASLDRLDAAIASREQEVQIRRALVQSEPSEHNSQGLAAALGWLGDLHLSNANPVRAKPLLEENVALCRAKAETAQTAEARHDFALALSELAGVLERNREPDRCPSFARRGRAATERTGED